MRRLALALVATWLCATASGPVARGQTPPAGDNWRAFEGSWSAVGQRQTLPTESGRAAAIVRLSGAVVIASGDGLSRGFRGELIGFDNGDTGSVGRWVWSDERGDRIFGEVSGGPVQQGRRIVGTITGGSGRYEGLAGEYEATWQYVVTGDDGTVQGRTTTLRGRYRRGSNQP